MLPQYTTDKKWPNANRHAILAMGGDSKYTQSASTEIVAGGGEHLGHCARLGISKARCTRRSADRAIAKCDALALWVDRPERYGATKAHSSSLTSLGYGFRRNTRACNCSSMPQTTRHGSNRSSQQLLVV